MPKNHFSWLRTWRSFPGAENLNYCPQMWEGRLLGRHNIRGSNDRKDVSNRIWIIWGPCEEPWYLLVKSSKSRTLLSDWRTTTESSGVRDGVLKMLAQCQYFSNLVTCMLFLSAGILICKMFIDTVRSGKRYINGHVNRVWSWHEVLHCYWLLFFLFPTYITYL